MKTCLRLAILFVVFNFSCKENKYKEVKEANTQPNILLLFSDDHQSDLIHALGNPYIQTPSLDQLIIEGTTFSQTFAQTPTCVPSRASLLTGCSPLTHKSFYPKYAGSANKDLKRWPQTMQEVGYKTFWTGKWNANGKPKDWGIEEGSRIYARGMGSHTMTFKENDTTVTGFSSELFADAAIDFLDKKHTKPFFMTVAFTAPHDPRTPPKTYETMYDPYEIPLPANFYASYPYKDGYSDIRDEKLLPYPRTVSDVRKELALYYGLISHMDTQIGRILKALKKNSLDENTIVIYASDNGLALGHHGLLGKFSFYRHSLNVPLIMKGPSIPKNKKIDSQIYLHDLYPTICDIIGAEIPKTVESKSFRPLLSDDKTLIHDYIFGVLSDVKRSVVTKDYKLIRHYYSKERDAKNGDSGTDEYLFYDQKNDPLEIVNQIYNPKFAKDILRLKKVLANWQEENNDFLPSEIY